MKQSIKIIGNDLKKTDLKIKDGFEISWNCSVSCKLKTVVLFLYFRL